MDERHEIEKTAYELFRKCGCLSGHELEHRLEAERIVHASNENSTPLKARKSPLQDVKKTKAVPQLKKAIALQYP